MLKKSYKKKQTWHYAVFFALAKFCWESILSTFELFIVKFGAKKNILVAKNSSMLINFHPFKSIFINFWSFHPTSR